MIQKIIPLICCLLIFGCNVEKEYKTKELIIVGTVHFPTKGINTDSIYQAIKKVDPEVILMERDSVSFDASFKRKKTYEENEDQAVSRYLKDNPTVLLRPFEFEGRNQYRLDMGLYPQANQVYQKLNALSRSNGFTEEEQEIWNKFAVYWMKLDSLSAVNLKSINTAEADIFIEKAKHYQYTLMKEFVMNHEEFNELMEDSKRDSISLKEYFFKWEKFEHYDRNNAMVDNVIRTIEAMPNQKFMLLVGYHHRYYLKNALNKKGLNIKITEFYDEH